MQLMTWMSLNDLASRRLHVPVHPSAVRVLAVAGRHSPRKHSTSAASFIVWLLQPKRWLPEPATLLAYFAFAFAVAVCWVMPSYMDKGQQVVEDWFKIIVFYVLFVTVVHDEKGLRQLALGFVLVMGVYMTHSLQGIPGRPAHLPHGHRAHDRHRHDAGRSELLRRQHRLRAAVRPAVLEYRQVEAGSVSARQPSCACRPAASC